MSLFSALGASVSGMAAQANSIAAISENISNSSTVGYKQIEAEFEDMVSQQGARDYSAGGVSTTMRTSVDEHGDLTATTSDTDFAVQGNGFFVVEDSSGATYLTRSGSFTKGPNGTLVNSSGYTLMGYSLAPGAAGVTNSLTGLVPVTTDGTTLAATASTTGTVAVNLPSGDTVNANPPSATNFNETTSVVAYDHLGNPVTLNVNYTKTGDNTWQMQVYDGTTQLGTTTTLNIDPKTGAIASTDPTTTPPNTLSVTLPGDSGGNAISLDISGTTQLGAAFSVTTAKVDGNAPSALSDVDMAPDGTLSYVYANGTEVPAFKVPLANVESPDNLTSVSGDAFQANSQSGNIVIGTPGSNGMGSIEASELESSTVDLATQLTNMIVAQRGYEANSKVFQAGSDLLSELVNLVK